jgi:NAD(P)-dependent dehydrogenase (short-subunit alcohol dehydrogenase family)
LSVLAYSYVQSSQMALAAARARNAAANYAGRHAVVVGGTSGIGEGIALRLAEANFSVTIVGRNAERGRAIVDAMRAKSGAASGAQHAFMAADAQYVASAKPFAAEYGKAHPRLDVLVLTQGIGTFQGRTETSEGLDQKLALHYFGRVAFMEALLPLMRAAPSPRVLTVLTAGVHPPYKHYDTDFELRDHYSLKNAADAGCMYNDIAVDALSREPENARVTFAHAAPGFVNTNIGAGLAWPLRMLMRAVAPLGRSPADCAEFMCTPVLRPDAEAKPGFQLLSQNAEPVPATPLHDAARDVVWAKTKEILARLM